MNFPLEHWIRVSQEVNWRFEKLRGIAVCEANPTPFHQMEIDRIRASVRIVNPNVSGIHVANVLFSFEDDTFVQPDIAFLAELPKPLETYEALNVVPTAVIEVTSLGFERKDLDFKPQFYLSNGVKDILIFDPRSKIILHHRKEWTEPKEFSSPARLELECGCEVTV